jgi:hypothetical protein
MTRPWHHAVLPFFLALLFLLSSAEFGRAGCSAELAKRRPAPEDLKDRVAAALSAAPEGISPSVDGRICLPGAEACLVEDWAR